MTHVLCPVIVLIQTRYPPGSVLFEIADVRMACPRHMFFFSSRLRGVKSRPSYAEAGYSPARNGMLTRNCTLSTWGSTGSKSTSPRPSRITTSHRASSPGCLLVISVRTCVRRNVVLTLGPSTTLTHHCHWTTRTVLWRASYRGVPYPSPHRMRRVRVDSASLAR